jgi:hypothetical protein
MLLKDVTAIAPASANSAKVRNLVSIVNDIERNSVASVSGVARALEARNVPTPRGNASWQAAQVSRLRAMAAA